MPDSIPVETQRRLDRAAAHIQLLRNVLDGYARPVPRKPGEKTIRPYRLARRWNDTTQCNDLVFSVNTALPDEVILLASESAHHLKSALDTFLYSLASTSGPVRTQIAFPLLDDEPHWAEDTERFERGIEPLPETARAAVRRLQPFRLLERGETERNHGENLLRLAYLLNEDRQRTPPLAFLPVPSTTQARNTGKAATSFLTDGLPIPTLKHNTVIRRCIPDQYDLSVQVAFNVVFGDEWPANLRRQPVPEVLKSIQETVTGYVLPEFTAATQARESAESV